MTNPVKQFRMDDKARLDLAVQQVQADLVTIDSQIAAKRDDVAHRTNDIAALQADESRLRQAIASATMPADADALVDQLEANLELQATTSTALTDAQDAAAVLERTRQRTASGLDAARAQQAQAAAALAAASADDDAAVAWRTAASGTVVGNAITAAGSASTTALRSGARTRLESLVGGAAMLDLFGHRFEEARADAQERHAAVARAQGALDTLASGQDPVGGDAIVKGAAFAAARDVVRSVAETTVQRFDTALVALQTASALGNLSVDEQQRIDDRATTATTVTGSMSPVDAENGILDARKDVRDAWVAFDTAALAGEATDATFDRDTDASVKTERDDWNQAIQDLSGGSGAESKLTPTRKQALDDWEVAIPREVSDAVIGYLRAAADVDEIKALNPVARVGDLGNDETAYAGALQARSDAIQWQVRLAGVVVERLDEAAAADPVADVREAAQVRGDR